MSLTLLVASVLTGLVGVAISPERYYTVRTGPAHTPLADGGHAEGELYSAQNKLRLAFWISDLATGPIMDAFMTSRSHPDRPELSLMPFLDPKRPVREYLYREDIRLSDGQVSQFVNGGMMLVVRSSNLPAAQSTGRIKLCRQFEASLTCTLGWSTSNGDPGRAVAKPSFARPRPNGWRQRSWRATYGPV